MPEAWTGRLIGRMHNNRITYAELGAEMGVGKAYVSQLLNGARKPKGIQTRMENALEAVLERRKKDAETAADSEA